MQVEQQQARQEQQEHDDQLQSFHGYVYTQLQSPRKDEILRRAAGRIKLWQDYNCAAATTSASGHR